MSPEASSFSTPAARRYEVRLTPGRGGAGDAARRAAPLLPLPCLSSNNSTEHLGKPDKKDPLADLGRLKGNHKRTAEALSQNVQWLAGLVGVQKLGFLTLTFADKVTCRKEAQRRYNSLLTHVLRPRYLYVIRVMERQKNGRIHYHLVVALEHDIRTGFDFEGIAKKDYSTASKELRAEWAFWRKTAPKYGFGRTELLPVKSTAEGIARYVGKYISKHIEGRLEEDKGARLVEYTRGARMQSSHFAWNTDGGRLHREKLGELTRSMEVPDGQLHRHLGSRYAFKFRKEIARIKLEKYWSDDAAELDWTIPYFEKADDITELILTGRKYRISAAEAAVEIGLKLMGDKPTRVFEIGESGLEPIDENPE